MTCQAARRAAKEARGGVTAHAGGLTAAIPSGAVSGGSTVKKTVLQATIHLSGAATEEDGRRVARGLDDELRRMNVDNH